MIKRKEPLPDIQPMVIDDDSDDHASAKSTLTRMNSYGYK